MLRSLIGTVAKGAALGIVVIGARKLWERQRIRPMKEPLISDTSYNGTATAFTKTPALPLSATPSETQSTTNVDRQESPALTRP